MGLMARLMRGLFGGGRNVVAETAGIFRENTEAGAQRSHVAREQALAQFAAEFRDVRRTRFDIWMDALNRVPRPAMALGVLGLFVAAMIDPVWFAARMQGLALVPEPLWWLLGVVVSFYFGSRYQVKAQSFRRDLAEISAQIPNATPVSDPQQTALPPSSQTPSALPTSNPNDRPQDPNPALDALIAARAA